MLSLIAAFLLISPPVTKVEDYNPETDKCRDLPTIEWRRCQPRVINLGTWDPVYHNRPE